MKALLLFRTIKPGPYPAQPGQRLASGAYPFSLSGDARAQRLITRCILKATR